MRERKIANEAAVTLETGGEVTSGVTLSSSVDNYYGAAWGTCVHRMMAAVVSGLPQERWSAMARAVLAEETVDGGALEEIVKTIEQVWHSPLGERLRRARQVLCEVPFGLVMSRNELQLDDLAVSEQVVVEGVIDLALREADGWVIGDYKTDLGAVDQRDALVAHYTPQLLNMPAFSRTSLANR